MYLGLSARRFCARCGNDPAPLWVDNFLSDTRALDYSRLVRFLELVLSSLPSTTTIRVLGRYWIGRKAVSSEDIVTSLREAGMSSELENRLRWRLYDQKLTTNLHRRELVLSTRRTAFSLPPARIVLGQDPAGNETDAVVAYASSRSTSEAWRNGKDIFAGGASRTDR